MTSQQRRWDGMGWDGMGWVGNREKRNSSAVPWWVIRITKFGLGQDKVCLTYRSRADYYEGTHLTTITGQAIIALPHRILPCLGTSPPKYTTPAPPQSMFHCLVLDASLSIFLSCGHHHRLCTWQEKYTKRKEEAKA